MKLKRKRFYCKRKYLINNRIIVFILLIIFFVYVILNFISNKIRPKLEDLIITNTNKSIYNYVFYMFKIEILTDDDILDIISIHKNDDGEIIAVDYKFNKAYEYLSNGMTELYENIDKIDVDMRFFDKDNDVFLIPYGYSTNNIFWADMGFKIPFKVKLLSDVKMGFKTRVSNYGVNNLLVELYLVVETKNNLIVPYYNKQFGEKYEIILASKIIVGDIPLYYGEQLEKDSAIISS